MADDGRLQLGDVNHQRVRFDMRINTTAMRCTKHSPRAVRVTQVIPTDIGVRARALVPFSNYSRFLRFSQLLNDAYRVVVVIAGARFPGTSDVV